MLGMKIGYIRVSTKEQNPARQEEIMARLGVERLYLDKQSGRNARRPQLQEMLEYMREGDTIVVDSISRLARSTKDLLVIVEKMQEKNVQLLSIKEQLDTSTPQGRFVLTMFGALAELEREQIRQHQLEGIELAKAAGKYKGRPRAKFDEAKLRSVCVRWRAKHITTKEAVVLSGLCYSSFYRRVKELGL